MTPLCSEGAVHEIVSWTNPGVADRSDTGPGTATCTGTHTNNATINICSLLTILQCLHSESCTVWSSPSSIDCCHLHRVASEWSQSSQHMLSAPLSCSVHNGGAIAVAQSVSSDGSSLVGAGYCSPLHSK